MKTQHFNHLEQLFAQRVQLKNELHNIIGVKNYAPVCDTCGKGKIHEDEARSKQIHADLKANKSIIDSFLINVAD